MPVRVYDMSLQTRSPVARFIARGPFPASIDRFRFHWTRKFINIPAFTLICAISIMFIVCSVPDKMSYAKAYAAIKMSFTTKMLQCCHWRGDALRDQAIARLAVVDFGNVPGLGCLAGYIALSLRFAFFSQIE